MGYMFNNKNIKIMMISIKGKNFTMQKFYYNALLTVKPHILAALMHSALASL